MVETATISQAEARRLAERCAERLRRQFGATRVVIFGSVAGDAPWHSQSDLDLAVEGVPPEAFSRALRACYELLPPGLTLDLILLESAWPALRARIDGEIEMPDEPIQALRFEIGNELDNLERLVGELAEFLQEAPEPPHKMQVQGAAKSLHDFYNGVERIFERVAVRIDGDLPAGPSWHTLLLQRMSRPYGSQRPALIDDNLEASLSEYLRFRHLFRHTYGYDLEWERVKALGEGLPDLLADLKEQLADFLSTLAD